MVIASEARALMLVPDCAAPGSMEQNISSARVRYMAGTLGRRGRHRFEPGNLPLLLGRRHMKVSAYKGSA